LLVMFNVLCSSTLITRDPSEPFDGATKRSSRSPDGEFELSRIVENMAIVMFVVEESEVVLEPLVKLLEAAGDVNSVFVY
jgi:hypothetical protein